MPANYEILQATLLRGSSKHFYEPPETLFWDNRVEVKICQSSGNVKVKVRTQRDVEQNDFSLIDGLNG